MPVIINDLEVVVDSEQPPPLEQIASPPAEPPVHPEDLTDVVERHVRLLTRVLAH